MRREFTAAVLLASGVACAGILQAQGRGGGEWPTSGGDAQRTSWIRTDAKISKESLQKPGAFKFLWKLRLSHQPKPLRSLTQPILLDRLIGFRGFKSIAFVGASSDTVYAIDTDLGTELWKVFLNYSASPPPVTAGTLACPGGLSAAITRPTPLAPAAGGGAGRGGGRGGRSGGGVGEPGRGAPSIYTAGQARCGGGGRGAVPAPPGGAPVPGSAAAAAAAPRAGGPGAGRGRGAIGAPDAAYVVGSDGYLRALNVQNGWDMFPPALFLPANTRPAGLILVSDAAGQGFLYTATTNGCGSAPDAVWAIEVTGPAKTVTSWKANGATIAGTSGPTLGTDGTIYVATSDGSSPLSNSIVALEPMTLKLKGSFTAPKADFSASPVVFQMTGKDVIAAAGGGRVYLLDSTSLGSGPLGTSPHYGGAAFDAGALASWQDAQGTRWIAAPSSGAVPASAKFAVTNGLLTNGALVAFKVVEQDGKLTLQPGWVSRDMMSPMTPVVINGVVFAVSSGEYRPADDTVTAAVRTQRSLPAVLYALDAATGKELWSSGRTMTSFARGGIAGGSGVVFVPTFDGTVYAFGFPIEK